MAFSTLLTKVSTENTPSGFVSCLDKNISFRKKKYSYKTIHIIYFNLLADYIILIKQ